MAFCANCGAEIPENAKFCAACGTPVKEDLSRYQESAAPVTEQEPVAPVTEPEPITPVTELESVAPITEVEPVAPITEMETAAPDTEPAAPVKKRLLPRIAILAAALVAIAAIVIAVILSVKANSPENLITTAIARTVDSAFSEQTKDLLSKGSITISSDLGKWETDKLFGIDELPLKLLMKLTFGGEEYAALQAKVDYDGENILDAILYETQTQIIMQCEQLLPDCYGIDIANLKDILQESVWASGNAYGLSKNVFNTLMQNSERRAQQYQETQSKLTESLDRYYLLLIKTACEKGNATTSGQKYTIDDETIATTAVSLSIDGDAMAEIMTVMYDAFTTDQELRSLFEEYFEAILSTYPSDPSMPSGKEIVDEMYEEMLSSEAFDEAMDAVRNSDILLEPVFYIAKSGKQLAAFELAVTAEGESGKLTLQLGDRLTASKCICLKLEGAMGAFSLTRTVQKDTKDAFESKVVCKASGIRIFTLECNWDKKAGDFSVGMDAVGIKLNLSGTLHVEKTSSELTISRIEAGGESVGIDLCIALNSDEPTMKVPAFKDVLTLSEQDIEQLGEAVSENMENLEEWVSENLPFLSSYSPIGGDDRLVGDWTLSDDGYKGLMDFSFAADGTGTFSTYGSEAGTFTYYTDETNIYFTTQGITEGFPYTLSDGTLYLTIGGDLCEFVRP